MKVIELTERSPQMLSQLFAIWERSVRATHTMRFRTYKRTDCDEQGGPYPLYYMKLDKH